MSDIYYKKSEVDFALATIVRQIEEIRNRAYQQGVADTEYRWKNSNDRVYNKALEDIFNLAKQSCYDDGADYSIGLQKLDELITKLMKSEK